MSDKALAASHNIPLRARSQQLEIPVVPASLHGAWIDHPFDAGDYVGEGTTTWTVAEADVLLNRYKLLDANTLLWQFHVEMSTVAGTPTAELQITLPGAFSAAAGVPSVSAGIAEDDGTNALARLEVDGGASIMRVSQGDGTAWAAATDTTKVAGQIIIEL